MGSSEATRELVRRQQNWAEVASAIGTRYADCTVAGFELAEDPEVLARQQRVVLSLQDYGDSIAENIRAGRGLVLFGPVGTGKDHLLVGLMRLACREGFTVRWINGMDLYGEMRDSIDKNQTEYAAMRPWVSPDVLVISDPIPPWGPLTPFQSQFLFRVLDHRYRNRRPVWVTANFKSRKDAGEKLGDQLVDRLADGAVTLFCDWPSHRRTA